MSIITLQKVAGKQIHYQQITLSGTWLHPEPGVAYRVYVEIIAGGGGGGGGPVHQASSGMGLTLYGGSCGTLGGRQFVETVLDANQAVFVGGGGTGGSARTTTINTTLAGLNGNPGGNSSFGQYRAIGGAGGNGGQSGSANSASAMPNYYRGNLTPAVGVTAQVDYFNRPRAASASSGTNTGFGGYGGGSYISEADAAIGGACDAAAGRNVAGGSGAHSAAYNYGGSGAGGGPGIAAINGGTLTASSGAGGNGSDGVVRVWAWREGQ